MRNYLLWILTLVLIVVLSAGCTAEYKVSVDVEPADTAHVSGEGVYERGELVTLQVEPEDGYEFRGWVEDGQTVSEDGEYEFEIEENRQLTAVFELREHEVAAEPNDKSMGSVSGSGKYEHGEMASVKAEPEEGYEFRRWVEEGQTVSLGGEYEFEIDEDRELTAVFELREYEVTVEANVAAMGTVIGSGTYEPGQTVTVKAEPEEGYVFEYWVKNGEVLDEAGRKYEFQVEQDSNLVAVYDINFDHLVLTDDLSGYLLPVVHDGALGLINMSGETVIRFTDVVDTDALKGPPGPNPHLRYFLPLYVDETNPLVLPVLSKDEEGKKMAVLLNAEGQPVARHPRRARIGASRLHNDYGSISYADGRYGFVDHSDNEIVGFEYDAINIADRFLVLTRDEKVGIFDSRSSEMILEPIFDDVGYRSWLEHELFMAVDSDGTYLFDLHGELVTEIVFDDARPSREGLVAVKKGDEWGFIDMSGQIVIEPSYDEVDKPAEGLVAVRRGRQWGFINATGEVIIEPQYDEVKNFTSTAMCEVKRDGRWGVIDTEGNWILKPNFDRVNVREDLIEFETDDTIGFADDTGDVVIQDLDSITPLSTDSVGRPAGGPYAFRSDDKWGILSSEGEVVQEPIFEHFVPPHGIQSCDPAPVATGYSVFRKDGYRAIFHEGEFITRFRFTEIRSRRPMEYSGVIQMIARDDEEEGWGLYDVKKGEYIVPPGQYDDVDYLIEDRIQMQQAGKYGFLNEDGQLVIEPQYYDATSFTNEVAVVRSGSKLHVIDRKGKDVVEPVEIEPEEQDISLYYFEDADIYRTIGYGYICTDEGWIREPQ